jgi:small subunit ribosomal protein S5
LKETIDYTKLDLKERTVHINRVAKVIKGGKRFKFSVIVIVGDGHGHVGYALGKAREVPDAIKKAVERAKKNLMRVPLKGTTIPYEVTGEFGSAKVLLKPASTGTGVIAGGAIRAIMESAGIHDILSKCLGRTSNPYNIVYATFEALNQIKEPEKILEMRQAK